MSCHVNKLSSKGLLGGEQGKKRVSKKFKEMVAKNECENIHFPDNVPHGTLGFGSRAIVGYK